MLTVAPGDADWFWDQQWISIPAAATAGSPVRTVTIQTKPEWNGKPATGQILVLTPWDTEPDIPQAELIDGPRGVWDGSLKPERVPNILFVPVGITGTDQSTFAQFTATMVHRLRTDRRLNPYPYLADAMNFWRLPIAATEAGVSVRCEVVPFTHQGRLFALPVRAPVRPPDSGTWKLEHLIYAAGLPMPSDQAGSVTIPQLRSRWAGQLRSEWAPKMQVPATVPNGVIEAWQKCAARTFVDEVDNFPAVAIGEPPKIEFDDSGELLLHPWRGGSDMIPSENAERVALFRRVTAAPRNGVTISIGSGAGAGAIGNLWAGEIRRSNSTIETSSRCSRIWGSAGHALVAANGWAVVRCSCGRRYGSPVTWKFPGCWNFRVSRSSGRPAAMRCCWTCPSCRPPSCFRSRGTSSRTS
jgi:hypothetical protein